MSRQQITIIRDDIDGSDADETIVWAIDGSVYEIDLNNSHARDFREAVAKFQDASRRLSRFAGGQPVNSGTTRQVSRPTPSGPAAISERDQRRAIRQWAGRNGIPVAATGRIPEHVVQRYQREAGRATA